MWTDSLIKLEEYLLDASYVGMSWGEDSSDIDGIPRILGWSIRSWSFVVVMSCYVHLLFQREAMTIIHSAAGGPCQLSVNIAHTWQMINAFIFLGNSIHVLTKTVGVSSQSIPGAAVNPTFIKSLLFPTQQGFQNYLRSNLWLWFLGRSNGRS